MQFEPPEMDYWQERPKDRLLDDRLTALSGDAYKAWHVLMNRSRTMEPPGILPADESILQRWSLLNQKQWKKIVPELLASDKFELDDLGRWHVPEVKDAHRAWALACFESTTDAKRNVLKRWEKKNGSAHVIFPAWVEPYALFPIRSHTPVYDRKAENAGSGSEMPPHAGVYAGIRPHSNRVSNELTPLGDGSPPASGAATAPGTPSPPPLRKSPAFSAPPPRHERDEASRANQAKVLADLDRLTPRPPPSQKPPVTPAPAADAAGAHPQPLPGETHAPEQVQAVQEIPAAARTAE